MPSNITTAKCLHFCRNHECTPQAYVIFVLVFSGYLFVGGALNVLFFLRARYLIGFGVTAGLFGAGVGVTGVLGYRCSDHIFFLGPEQSRASRACCCPFDGAFIPPPFFILCVFFFLGWVARSFLIAEFFDCFDLFRWDRPRCFELIILFFFFFFFLQQQHQRAARAVAHAVYMACRGPRGCLVHCRHRV
jgi:hypothetical protein